MSVLLRRLSITDSVVCSPDESADGRHESLQHQWPDGIQQPTRGRVGGSELGAHDGARLEIIHTRHRRGDKLPITRNKRLAESCREARTGLSERRAEERRGLGAVRRRIRSGDKKTNTTTSLSPLCPRSLDWSQPMATFYMIPCLPSEHFHTRSDFNSASLILTA